MAEAAVGEFPKTVVIKNKRKPINFTVSGEREVKVKCLIVLSQLESSLRAERIAVDCPDLRALLPGYRHDWHFIKPDVAFFSTIQ
jgi:hypothetical protein